MPRARASFFATCFKLNMSLHALCLVGDDDAQAFSNSLVIVHLYELILIYCYQEKGMPWMKEILLIALKLFAGENSVLLCWKLFFFLGGG